MAHAFALVELSCSGVVDPLTFKQTLMISLNRHYGQLNGFEFGLNVLDIGEVDGAGYCRCLLQLEKQHFHLFRASISLTDFSDSCGLKSMLIIRHGESLASICVPEFYSDLHFS